MFLQNSFFARTDTIFQCPKLKLFSQDEPITYQQCVNKDVTAMNYSSDPLLDARDAVPINGVPPPKRIKRMWKTVTTSKKEFSKRIFELAPDTFEHHQVLLLSIHYIFFTFALSHTFLVSHAVGNGSAGGAFCACEEYFTKELLDCFLDGLS